VFNIERGHAYQEIEKHIMELKNLNYPVFSIDRDHKYSEIQANIQDLKSLSGKQYSQMNLMIHVFRCSKLKTNIFKNYRKNEPYVWYLNKLII
jgi:hypothetical protein